MRALQLNLLTTIKNSARLGVESLFVKQNNSYLELILSLYVQGLIQSFYIMDQKVLINLRYCSGTNKFRDLKFISTVSYSHSLSYKNICRFRSDKHVILFSTDKGYLSSTDCKCQHLGGKLLFIC